VEKENATALKIWGPAVWMSGRGRAPLLHLFLVFRAVVITSAWPPDWANLTLIFPFAGQLTQNAALLLAAGGARCWGGGICFALCCGNSRRSLVYCVNQSKASKTQQQRVQGEDPENPKTCWLSQAEWPDEVHWVLSWTVVVLCLLRSVERLQMLISCVATIWYGALHGDIHVLTVRGPF